MLEYFGKFMYVDGKWCPARKNEHGEYEKIDGELSSAQKLALYFLNDNAGEEARNDTLPVLP